jgi:cell division protease FtsH
VLTASDFDAARDRIILGRREGSNVLLPEEKHAVAVHESGHALVAALSSTPSEGDHPADRADA